VALRQLIVVLAPHRQRAAQLFQVVQAARAVGGLAGPLKGRHQHGSKNGYDTHHDQQLDKRKAFPPFHGSSPVSKATEIVYMPHAEPRPRGIHGALLLDVYSQVFPTLFTFKHLDSITGALSCQLITRFKMSGSIGPGLRQPAALNGPPGAGV